jgi:3-(3-hydroxy-phenyl)propionate hydroxylase
MAYIPPKYKPVIPQGVGSNEIEKLPVLIVGAGPVGLALALDLGLRGHRVVILNQQTQLTDGSRAICFAKRPLEIMDRLGFGDRMVSKGVVWNIGKVFFQDNPDPVYSFDLLPEKDQKMPGMINLQQYYNEEYTIEALEALDNVELRWGNTLTAIQDTKKGVIVDVSTEKGDYKILADWLVACDGSRSPTRHILKMGFEGETFQDNFLIADVKFKKNYPTERHFWFDPAFNPGQSVLLHKQPDDVWRIDFQVGWDIDREDVIKPENVTPRIQAMFGEDVEFEYEWISVYTFNCRQVEHMINGNVIFAGDSAHLVSPFGARGANTGFQDADNLGWKLDLVLKGIAKGGLITSYDEERSLAAQVNILNSTRSTDFITPKSKVSRQFRNAVLQLSSTHEFVRGFVNSGRLSKPVPYPESSLNTLDEELWDGGISPGTNCIDAPIVKNNKPNWLLSKLGWDFKILLFAGEGGLTSNQQKILYSLSHDKFAIKTIIIGMGGYEDIKGLAVERYSAKAGDVYLIRPDQYVAARWHGLDEKKVRNAVQKALGFKGS